MHIDNNSLSIILLSVVAIIVTIQKWPAWWRALGGGIEYVFHVLTTQAHSSGVFGPYTCCHRCGKPQERICIPFYPCPCLFMREEILEIKRHQGRVRIVELGLPGRDGYRVEFGPALSSSTAVEPTIGDAVMAALRMSRAWNDALVNATSVEHAAALYLDADYRRFHPDKE